MAAAPADDRRLSHPHDSSASPVSDASPRLEPAGGRRLRLVVFAQGEATEHPLADGVAVDVGRGAEVDVRVHGHTLSRRHFRVCVERCVASIYDLESLNGTRLNGVRLPAHVPASLEIGALIEAGGVFFMLRDDGRQADISAPSADPNEKAGPACSKRADPNENAGPACSKRADPNENAGPLSSSARHLGAPVVVEAPAMLRLYELVGLVARSTMPVLLIGETGVGKEVLATAVHERSPRADKPLVRINCAALPAALLESELFGFERGAFTGATHAKPGLIESADGGSFLLDEIGEMPLGTQAKLLRVLESTQIVRLGALRPRSIDVRFIAATNRDLQKLLAAGQFRKDLYYRLTGITIPVPPLRERVEEIPKLAQLFAAAAASAMQRPPLAIAADAIALLRAHPWPGNVRQLKNVIARAVALCAGEEIVADHIRLDEAAVRPSSYPRWPRAPAAPFPVPARAAAPASGTMRVDPEDDLRRILTALEEAGGNQGRAAQILGISRKTLMRWLDTYGVPRPRKGARTTAHG
jgi:DNA-binding NtrC family response regulator